MVLCHGHNLNRQKANVLICGAKYSLSSESSCVLAGLGSGDGAGESGNEEGRSDDVPRNPDIMHVLQSPGPEGPIPLRSV